jgi:hypothetical protein
MAALNEQVAQFAVRAMNGEIGSDVTVLSERSLNMSRVALATARSYTGDNLALVGFGVGALALLGLMMRS